MSDATATPVVKAGPANAAQASQRVAFENEGVIVGRVDGFEHVEPWTGFDQKTGKQVVRKEAFFVTLALDGQPPLCLRVDAGDFSKLKGGDLLRIEYALRSKVRKVGESRFVDYFLSVITFKRVSHGDGTIRQRRERATLTD